MTKKIERIYIGCHKRGLHLTRCCVASIRKWYPRIPIALVKDELTGPFDTRDIEEHWTVEIFQSRLKRFGPGMGKFEVLTQTHEERCLVLDDDIVFLGEVLDRLEQHDETFVVPLYPGPPDEFEMHYFVPPLLREIDPDFNYTGGEFNSGQYVATTGMIKEQELDSFLTHQEPRTLKRPDIFKLNDQGLLSYLLLKKKQAGMISMGYEDFMWWSECLPEGQIRPENFDQGASLPMLVHWAGPKPATIEKFRHSELLMYFDRLFYSRIPEGQNHIVANYSRMKKRDEAVLRLINGFKERKTTRN